MNVAITSIDTDELSVEKIQELLGHTSIKAVRKLVECDPINLGAIVAKVI